LGRVGFLRIYREQPQVPSELRAAAGLVAPPSPPPPRGAPLQRRKKKVANRDVSGFGEIAHAAVTRRAADSPLHDGTRCAGGYAYDVGVWDLSIVQGLFSVAPCQTVTSRFATCASR
jgi:hypothetical protein